MADHMGELDKRDAGFELFDDESVTEVVDLGTLDPGDTKVAIDGRANVTDQERVAGFGDKEGGVFGFGALADVFFDGFFAGFVQGDFSRVVTFESTNFEIGLFDGDILELDPGQLTDPETGLEEELDNRVHADICADSVAEGTILERGENAGRSNLVFGMTDGGGGADGQNTFPNEELEE